MAGKYIQSGNTALQTGGSNSIIIQKENLPSIKLKIDTFSATLEKHYHLLFNSDDQFNINPTANNYIAAMGNKISGDGGRYYALSGTSKIPNVGKSLDGGGGTTGTVSPLTETMGNGTAIIIQPQYITLKFWKRLT